jgi:fructose-specific phosphotransferase system IIB component
MFVVAVTACPTGIAHTHIAADKLKKAAKRMGAEIKVETQGTIGTSNELSADDVKKADAVLIASAVSVSKMERFVSRLGEIKDEAELKRELAEAMKGLEPMR